MTKPIISSSGSVENSIIFTKDFSGKLPSSTPVVSPRYIADSFKNGHVHSAFENESNSFCRNNTNDDENFIEQSSSTKCPVPKPRRNFNIVSSNSDQLTIEEGCNLYLRFLYEEIKMRNLEAPPRLKVPESSFSITLRHVADEFSHSSHRLRVRDHAEAIQLENLSVEGFFELLDGLFKEGGVTYERVLVLFFFCTDITIRALRDNFVSCFNDLVSWSLKFFIENIFDLVQQNGGWACVLQKSADFTYKVMLMISLGIASIALISYLCRK